MDGTGDQPLILLHGLGGDYQSWKNVREHIDTSLFRVYIPDLLGFGDAPKPKNIQYTLTDHAEAVIGTIDGLELDNVMIAGHSLGSLVAIEVAMRRPDLIKHLTLLGVPLFEEQPTKKGLKKLFSSEGKYYSIAAYLQDNPDLVITDSTVAEDALPHLHGLVVNKDTWNAFERSLMNAVVQTKSFRDVGNLQVPTRMVMGTQDMFVNSRAIRKSASENKDYIKIKTLIGPHQTTPRQGKVIARILKRAAKKYGTS